MQGKINLHIDQHSSELIRDYVNDLKASSRSPSGSKNGDDLRSRASSADWPDQVRGGCPIRALLEHYNGVPSQKPRSAPKITEDDKLRLHLSFGSHASGLEDKSTQRGSPAPSPRNSNRSDQTPASQSAQNAVSTNKTIQSPNPSRAESSARSTRSSDLEEFRVQIHAMTEDKRNDAIDTEIIDQGDDMVVIYRI